MIKSFRGQIADGAQVTINLHTNDGKTGYRIVKLDFIDSAPGIENIEAIVKIYSKQQTPLSVDGLVNFSDNTLLGVLYYSESKEHYYPGNVTVIFDKVIINQDIYVTYSDVSGSSSGNYYLELEQISLDLNASTVATLQSIRQKATGTVTPP